MSMRTILVLVVSGLLALFTVVNWSTFVAPTHLSLVVTSVDAPLGLVMLAFTVALAAVLLLYALKVQVNALSDGRKQAEELRRHRELADQAEASRFTELRAYFDQQLASLRQVQQANAEKLHEDVSAAVNTLAACIGEVDDRLERQWPTPPDRQP